MHWETTLKIGKSLTSIQSHAWIRKWGGAAAAAVLGNYIFSNAYVQL